MELSKKMAMALLALVLTAPAFADHEGGGLDSLVSAARNLSQAVSYSSLRYTVKSSVYSFTQEVEELHQCAHDRGFIGSEVMDHATNDHTGGIPAQCQHQLGSVRSYFAPVDRFLYDTYYDYPQVYQAYQFAKSALSGL